MTNFKIKFYQHPFFIFMLPMSMLIILELIFCFYMPLIILTIFLFLTAYKISEIKTKRFNKYVDKLMHKHIKKKLKL